MLESTSRIHLYLKDFMLEQSIKNGKDFLDLFYEPEIDAHNLTVKNEAEPLYPPNRRWGVLHMKQ
jgi:hypothetical protein